MLKPAKQPHIRLTALFLCVTMFLSTLFFNAHTAYAADGTIDYKAGAKIPYGDYYTSRMSFDGNNTAYCVEPLKKTPASGKYPYNLLGKNSPLRKALYYLNGGYGYEKVIKDQYFQGWSDDNSYVIGHLVVSYPKYTETIAGGASFAPNLWSFPTSAADSLKRSACLSTAFKIQVSTNKNCTFS